MTKPHTSHVWRRKDLGDAMLAQSALADVEAAAAAAWRQDPIPGFAVLARHESEGRLHCAVQVYFSPAANALAREIGAMACRQPTRDGLSLLAGDAAVLASL